jgi:hypothetical protein
VIEVVSQTPEGGGRLDVVSHATLLTDPAIARS